MEEDTKTTTLKTTKAKKPVVKLGQPSAAEDTASKYPDMEIGQKIHRLTTKQTIPMTKEEQQAVLDDIAKTLENPSLYRSVVEMVKTVGIMTDLDLLSEDKLAELDKAHQATLKELEEKVEEARESAGDMEVMDATLEIARFCAKSLPQKQALEAYQKVIDLPKISSGKKIDALMETSRVASFYGDTRKSDEYIEAVRTVAAL